MKKTIGIVGLGLIGGSLAKAIEKRTNNNVLGYDIDECIVNKAIEQKVISGKIDETNISECDFLIVALYPQDTIDYITKVLPLLKKGTVIIDCCGVKQTIIDALLPKTHSYGVYFIGGHPMAGKEFTGYENSDDSMFMKATMILCTSEETNSVAIKSAELLFEDIGFGKITITTAKEHDKMIAFTSQLAHITSSAYIKSETAKLHNGFSAGSYKDLTRVAKLNVDMWSQLFLENKEFIANEIDMLVNNLEQYKTAIINNDDVTLKKLLQDGVDAKEKLG